MAAPNRQSIDEEFRQGNYNQNGWGVQNAQINKMMAGVQTGNAANTPNRPKQKYSGPQEQNEYFDKVSQRQQMVDERYYVDPREQMQEAVNSNSAPSKQTVHTSLLARARGITFGVVTISWMTPIYFFWQMPMAMIGASMLGLASQIEQDTMLSAIDSLAQSFGSLVGYEYFDVAGLGMLAVIMSAVFGVASSCIAGFTAILWGLHPISGNAAGTKKVTFFVGVVGACIPFASMFPWIIFWILVMMRHPK